MHDDDSTIDNLFGDCGPFESLQGWDDFAPDDSALAYANAARPDQNMTETDKHRRQNASLLPRRTVHVSREDDWYGRPPHTVAFEAPHTEPGTIPRVGGASWKEIIDNEDPYPLANLLHAYGLKPADERNPFVDKFAEGGLNLPQGSGELDDQPTQTEQDAMAMACEVDRYLELYPGASKLPLWGAGYDFKARRKELEKMSVEEREAASADSQEIDYDEFEDLKLPSGSTTRPHRVPIPEKGEHLV